MEGVETLLANKDQNEMDMAGKIDETVRTLLSVILTGKEIKIGYLL